MLWKGTTFYLHPQTAVWLIKWFKHEWPWQTDGGGVTQPWTLWCCLISTNCMNVCFFFLFKSLPNVFSITPVCPLCFSQTEQTFHDPQNKKNKKKKNISVSGLCMVNTWATTTTKHYETNIPQKKRAVSSVSRLYQKEYPKYSAYIKVSFYT